MPSVPITPTAPLRVVSTAAAASSFALTLAALCRNRAQLNAVAVILILCMSALGGSMVPRYVMSETMQQVGPNLVVLLVAAD